MLDSWSCACLCRHWQQLTRLFLLHTLFDAFLLIIQFTKATASITCAVVPTEEQEAPQREATILRIDDIIKNGTAAILHRVPRATGEIYPTATHDDMMSAPYRPDDP